MKSRTLIYKKHTLILCSFALAGLLTLACDPEDAHFPSESYSMWVVNDTEETLVIQSNIGRFSTNSVYTSSDWPEYRLLPGDSLVLMENKFYQNNDDPFQKVRAVLWVSAKANHSDIVFQVYGYRTDKQEKGRLLREWKYTGRKPMTHHFFCEDAWKRVYYDNQPDDPYDIHHYEWTFPLKENVGG